MRVSLPPTRAPSNFPSLPELLRDAAGATEDEFAGRHPGQFLILERVHGSGSTIASRPGAPPVAKRGPLDVLPVAKRDENNPFTSMVTIGRARNNDIVVDDDSVGRMHAWIRRAGDTIDGTSATVTDAGSTSETFVNNVPVRAETVPLALGAHLRIGRVEFCYVDARQLHAALRAARAAA